MRNDINEPGLGLLVGKTGFTVYERILNRTEALTAPAVDAALEDDAPHVVAQRGSRRELAGAVVDADRRTIDVPHVAGAAPTADAPSDGALLRRLSQQLSSLQTQQEQIRRLLDQAEQRSAASRSKQSGR